MDEDGLPMESMGYDGDSGSGSFVMRDDELFLVGVNSYGDRPKWGSNQGDVWAAGPARAWIKANLESDTHLLSRDFGCSSWGSNTRSLDDDSEDPDDEDLYFDCDCDCDSDNDECEAECRECMAASKAHTHF